MNKLTYDWIQGALKTIQKGNDITGGALSDVFD